MSFGDNLNYSDAAGGSLIFPPAKKLFIGKG